jgi:hypothetical protein
MTFLCGKISTRGNTNLTDKHKKGKISVRLQNIKNAAKERLIAKRQEGNNLAVKAFKNAKGIKCCIYKTKSK